MMKRTNVLSWIFILLAAGLLAGCTRADDPTPQKEIAVTTTVTGMLKRIYSFTDNTDLQAKDIRIDAYYDDTETAFLDGAKLHYDTDTWKFWVGSEPGSETHYYWPVEGSKTASGATASTLDFVGYCPFTAPTYITPEDYDAENGASFSCDVCDYMTNAAQATMQEYLIAVLPNQTLATQTAAGGALPLTFKHPFALIKFVIAEGSGTHVQVNSISIAGLHTSGTCTCNAANVISWGSHAGSAAMTITPATPLKYGTASTETEDFMVIPCEYAGTKTLTVNGTWDEWSNNLTKDISTDMTFEWLPGYKYTYNLTVTPNALIVNTTKFTEQW